MFLARTNISVLLRSIYINTNNYLIMNLRALRILHHTSSRKFFEIVASHQQQLLPSSPEQLLISKYLKDQRNIYQNLKKKSQQTVDKSSFNKNVNYDIIMEKNPNGSIIQQKYKNLELNLVSLNFRNIKLKDVYEISQKFNPDIVLVQGRPQYYIPYFKLLPRRREIFSDQLYLKQLIIESNQARHLLSDDLFTYFSNLIKGKEINKEEKIFIQDTKGPIGDQVILMSSYFSSINDKAMIFGEIPEQPLREWLCNSHTLMQLQELFKHICKDIPYYQSLNLSLQKLACILKPQLFLNLRDRYLATLIQMLVAQGKYTKVIAFMGMAQNQAVWDILSNNKLIQPVSESNRQQFTPLLEYLVGPPIKSSVIRNVSGWQVIQKHLILDIMKYGFNIVNIPVDQFTVTNKVIEHYGMMINSYQEENIMKFRFDKVIQYLDIMKNKIEEGKQLKKKFMLREAIRSQQDQQF